MWKPAARSRRFITARPTPAVSVASEKMASMREAEDAYVPGPESGDSMVWKGMADNRTAGPGKNDARLKIDRSVWSFEIWRTAALMLILKRGSKQRGRKNLMDIILTAFVS